MGASVQPVPEDVNVPMVQLASRIAAHLHANPHDTQAQVDLQYVIQKMRGTAQTANRATEQQAQEEGSNLGPLLTFGQRAGNAMSFGLGDAVGRTLEGPDYQASVNESERRNPVSAIGGTLAGGAIPFFVPGAGALKIRSALGALEGFGIGNGNLAQRVVGAGIGAGGAAVLPAIARGAGAIMRGTLGRLLGRFATSATESAPEAAGAVRGGTSEVGAVVPDAGTTSGPEGVIRANLAQQGKSPAQIDEAVAYLKREYGSLNRPGIAAQPVTRPVELPEGFIRRQVDAPAGGPGSTGTPPSAPTAPAQPSSVQAPPAAPQRVSGHYYDYAAQKWVPQPESGPAVVRVDASGARHLETGVIEAPTLPERAPGRPVVRAPGAASAAGDPNAMWRELMTYPLTPQIQGEMGPALQAMDRGAARAMMAHVAQADAFGSIPAPWRDFLLTNLAKAGSAR